MYVAAALHCGQVRCGHGAKGEHLQPRWLVRDCLVLLRVLITIFERRSELETSVLSEKSVML